MNRAVLMKARTWRNRRPIVAMILAAMGAGAGSARGETLDDVSLKKWITQADVIVEGKVAQYRCKCPLAEQRGTIEVQSVWKGVWKEQVKRPYGPEVLKEIPLYEYREGFGGDEWLKKIPALLPPAQTTAVWFLRKGDGRNPFPDHLENISGFYREVARRRNQDGSRWTLQPLFGWKNGRKSFVTDQAAEQVKIRLGRTRKDSDGRR